MNVEFKCNICQLNYSKLIAPFENSSDKFCLACFAFGIGMNASEKPDLVAYFASLARQAQTQLENSKPNSIVFIVRNTNEDKLNQ
jgi:hypothetical protein